MSAKLAGGGAGASAKAGLPANATAPTRQMVPIKSNEMQRNARDMGGLPPILPVKHAGPEIWDTDRRCFFAQRTPGAPTASASRIPRASRAAVRRLLERQRHPLASGELENIRAIERHRRQGL